MFEKCFSLQVWQCYQPFLGHGNWRCLLQVLWGSRGDAGRLCRRTPDGELHVVRSWHWQGQGDWSQRRKLRWKGKRELSETETNMIDCKIIGILFIDWWWNFLFFWSIHDRIWGVTNINSYFSIYFSLNRSGQTLMIQRCLLSKEFHHFLLINRFNENQLMLFYGVLKISWFKCLPRTSYLYILYV